MKKMKNKILVIEPHSDDGIIGAGGYLLKHKKDSENEFDFKVLVYEKIK